MAKWLQWFVCSQQICTSRRLHSCMRQLICFFSQNHNFSWRALAIWITFHLVMGKKPHDQSLFLPYGCLAFRLLNSQTFKLFSPAQVSEVPELGMAQTGAKGWDANQNHCLSYLHCCWDKLIHKITLLNLNGSTWPLLSQLKAIWPEASHFCLSVPSGP